MRQPFYGPGTVKGSDPTAKVRIRFGSGEKKNLIVEYAKLQGVAR